MRKFYLLAKAVCLSVAMLFMMAANAQTIAWNFTAGTAAPSTTSAVVTTTDLVQGNNNGTTTFITSTSASSSYAGASGTFNAGMAARTGALNTGVSGSAYVEFTLSIATGSSYNAATVTAINFGCRSTSTAPQAYSIRSSADNYATDLATGTISNNSAWALKTNSGLSAVVGYAGLTIRIYGYNGTGSASANTANFRIDDITVAVAPSANADLKQLAIVNDTYTTTFPLTPAFSAATTAYSTSVNSNTASVYFSFAPAITNSMVDVSLNGGAFGSPLLLFPLNVGNNTLEARVHAQDGVTLKSYTVTINRAAPAVPALTVNTALAAFGSNCLTATPTINSFTIEGSSLDGSDINISALPGFSYATDANGTFTSTLSFSYTGGAFAAKTIYVKFAPTAVQSYDGTIYISGGGITPVPVAASGSGINTLPTVSTGANIVAGNSAAVNGTLSVTGCGTVTAVGFEYSTTAGFANGTGTQVLATNLSAGAFSTTIAGLTGATTYYYKAFATNAAGTSYGTQNSFSTSFVVPVVMSAQPLLRYTENFTDIANWSANFTSGIGATHFSSVAVNTTGSIPSATRITTSSAAFSSGTSGGVQKGTGNIQLLATGGTDNSSSVAFEFYMNFTGMNAGTLSFDWASVNNSTGNRNGSLRVYGSTDGITYTEIPAANVINITNNIPSTGTVNSVALPASFNNSPTARLRFYYYNGTGGVITPPATTVSGSRPKISIDNLTVTGVASTPCETPAAAPSSLVFGTVAETSVQGSFTAATQPVNEYLVVMSTSPTLTSLPIDGQTYFAGDNIGDGTVIDKGSDLSFTATGLTGATTYYFFVFPVNSVCTGGPKYLTSNPLTADVTTVAGLPACVAPVAQPTALVTVAAINAIQGSFTAATADEYLVLQSSSASLTDLPVNGTSYAAGTVLGNAVVVQRGAGTSFTAANLAPATQYYYFVFSINSQDCVNGPVYNTTSPLSGAATTQPLPVCVTPSAQPANLSFNASNSSVTGTFNPAGTGYHYLVVKSSSPSLTSVPVDNTDYAVGDNLGGGTVVANTVSTSFIATNLNSSTTYYFFVFATNKNCTGGTKYLVTAPLSGNATTTNAPVYNYYFGNLHAHSSYSDGNKDNAAYTPINDYAYAAQSQGMDFLGISEHNHFSSLDNPGNELANYRSGVAQAALFNAANPNFLALYGMEWGVIKGGGHVLIYGDGLSELFGWESNVNGTTGPNYDIYVPKSTYLGSEGLFKVVNDFSAKNAFATLAHPNSSDFDNLANIPYDPAADDAISGTAVESGPSTSTNTTYSNPGASMFYLWYYQKLLSKGYHLGPTIDHDNHNTTFGRHTAARTAVLAPSLTQSEIIKSVRDMHFYATEDMDAKVDFTINTKIMGSIFEDRNAPSINVSLTDPTNNTSNALIRVMYGQPGTGVFPVVIDSVYGSSLSFVDNNLANNATGYYYIDITNGSSRIVTSPIWYTRTCTSSSEFTVSACDSYEWAGTVYTTSTVATKVFTGTDGCISTVTMHLTINNSPASVTITPVGADTGCPANGVALTATADLTNGAISSYEWYQNGNLVATTATGNYTAFATGAYAVKAIAATTCSVSSGTITATVTDTEAPVIVLPAPVTQNNDGGACGAIVNFTATATDNCSPVTITYSKLPGSLFTVGITTVTVTATDASGNTSTADFTVTVSDTEKPTITAPFEYGVVSEPGQCGANIADIGTPIVADNCGVLSVTNNHPSTYYPVGATIVTWTVTDIHGNITDTAQQIITVVDNELPSIIVTDISAAAMPGICGANLTLAMPVTADNCGVASVSNNHPGSFYPVGVTNVIWTVTDLSGMSKTALQKVTVTDPESPVISVLPADQSFCVNGTNSYTVPSLGATDNCTVSSISYSITGATNRTGTGNDASGLFNAGVSTITWTVSDAAGNTTQAATTVTINTIPSTAITSSNADAFCNSVTLTAGTGGSYLWSTGSTAQQITLGQSDGDGLYSVTVTVNGCTSAPATYTYQKQNLVSSYTILAEKEVKLGENNKVNSGSVGVRSVKGEAGFRSNSSVSSPGSFVKAARIDKKGWNITISNPIYSAATGISLPAMYLNNTNTNYLPNKEVSANSVSTVNGNYKNLTLKKGSRTIVTGNLFGSIRVEQGAQVTFTSATVNMNKLEVVKGPRNGYSYIRFSGDTRVLVSGNVSVGSQVYINPDNYKVTFYMGDSRSDEEKFTVKGGDTKVTANIYIPNGKLKVTGGYSYGNDNRDEDEESCYGQGNSYVNMTGLFIAEEVEGNGKNVIWNSFSCGSSPVPVLNYSQSVTQSVTGDKSETTSEEALQVTVLPNPSTTYFTLKLSSRYTTPVSLRVVDENGRVVDAKSGIGANRTIQVGHAYLSGTYFAEMTQGTQRKIIKLIKAK